MPEVYIYTFKDRDIQDYRVYNGVSTLVSPALGGLKIIVEELFS